jgi:hypothetical protein
MSVPPDAKGIRIEVQGQRIAHLSDARAVEIKTLVAGAGVLVVGADDVPPAAVPERARDVVLQPVVGPEEVPGEAAAVVVEDVAAVLAADDGAAGTSASSGGNTRRGRPRFHQATMVAKIAATIATPAPS